GGTELGEYWDEPEGSESAFWVYELSEVADGRMQVAMCEYNDYVARDLSTDEVLDQSVSSSFWDGQVAPTDSGWRIVAFIKANGEDGRAGCARQ
ncbi:MAG: hypothetical protein R3F08_17950, partial [Dokdonella sp.]